MSVGGDDKWWPDSALQLERDGDGVCRGIVRKHCDRVVDAYRPD